MNVELVGWLVFWCEHLWKTSVLSLKTDVTSARLSRDPRLSPAGVMSRSKMPASSKGFNRSGLALRRAIYRIETWCKDIPSDPTWRD